MQRVMNLPLRGLPCLIFLFSLLTWPVLSLADSVVVFNEVHYHPVEREAELEWVELHNQMAVDVDLSGWYLSLIHI